MKNPPLSDNWLEVGKIVAPQGLQGELRVASDSDFPERFEQPGKRWLLSPNSVQPQEVELLGGRYIPGKDLYAIRLAGVENRDQAEALRGYRLLVLKSDRPQLDSDEYHVADLIDLEVYNQLTGENIGVVIDIILAGSDLLEVQLHREKEKKATVLIPFVKEIVPVVDLEGGRIEIEPPPGLLEINQQQG
jgi:16S rRNA processing protein RimM